MSAREFQLEKILSIRQIEDSIVLSAVKNMLRYCFSFSLLSAIQSRTIYNTAIQSRRLMEYSFTDKYFRFVKYTKCTFLCYKFILPFWFYSSSMHNTTELAICVSRCEGV